MKKLKFSTLFFFLTLVSAAQITAPEKRSTWIYDYANNGSFGPIFCTYERDSTVNGRKAIVIDAIYYDQVVPKNVSHYVDNLLVIEDSTVFYWNKGRFDTLYYFGAEVGDGWSYFYYSMGLDTTRIEVIEKGVNQDLGAYFIMQYETSSFSPDGNLELVRDTIYEKLLGGSNYIIPTDYIKTIIDGQEGGPLFCYSNSEGRYSDRKWTPFGKPCKDIIDKLDIKELSQEKEFAIYPNPSRGIIQAKNTQKAIKMEVFSLEGELIYTSEDRFMTKVLSPQTYIVKLWKKGGFIEIHKVTVQ